MRTILLLLMAATGFCQSQKHDAIINKFLKNCAWQYNYHSYEWQQCIDEGLEKDSTVAYLWQQKAMPYFKEGKYEMAMPYLDKAVQYDKQWLPYRGFMKCIFAKAYTSAIADFEECIRMHGNSYEMDHTYRFYIALSYLQLNRFKEAEELFYKDLQEIAAVRGEGAVHHLELFYYGISKYEQQKWDEAIAQFDRALKLYPEFSDVKYYKFLCLKRLGKQEEAERLHTEAARDFKNGYTINEDNAIYEKYPYQITRYH